jgi:hypothetical protein
MKMEGPRAIRWLLSFDQGKHPNGEGANQTSDYRASSMLLRLLRLETLGKGIAVQLNSQYPPVPSASETKDIEWFIVLLLAASSSREQGQEREARRPLS